MKAILDRFVDSFLHLFAARTHPFPPVGHQSFKEPSCRTEDGRACTVSNIDEHRR